MTEQEFHNSRIAFYVDRGHEHEVKTIPTGFSHKQALGYRYETIEKYSVRGYLKDNVLMLYQGENFDIPTAEYDVDKILRALRITKKSLDYIGLGCKVGEVGETWEPIEKIEFNDNFKYISYMITLGGDAGWRFSNQPEWCSTEYTLLFDSKKWTMESIAKEMNILWHGYWDCGKHGHSYSDKYDLGIGAIKNLINKDGVFVKDGGLQAPDEKILNPSITEYDFWCMNGEITNYDYDK